MRTRLPALLVLLLIGSLAHPARAQEAVARSTQTPPVATLSKADAGKAIRAFDTALRAARGEKGSLEREAKETEAVRALAAGAHEAIDARLAKAASDTKLVGATRVAALDALTARGQAAAAQADRLRKWLFDACADEADALRSGDIGVPIDRRTGDAETNSPEARKALREGRERATLLAAGLRALRASGAPPKAKDAEKALAPLLQSPFDDLAVLAVRTAADWDLRGLAEEVGLLLRMYPRNNRWETGAVTHLGGTNASAKAAWMQLFGHPNKQRARPELHQALLACAATWAGRTIDGPDAYAAWLARAER